MTWNEFKEKIDSQLADKGLTGDIKVFVIDVRIDQPECIEVDVSTDRSFINIYD